MGRQSAVRPLLTNEAQIHSAHSTTSVDACARQPGCDEPVGPARRRGGLITSHSAILRSGHRQVSAGFGAVRHGVRAAHGHTRKPCGCREPCHVMRPARTRVRGRRVDLVAAVGVPPWTVGEWRLWAAADAASGAGDECCSARCTPRSTSVRWRGPVISRWSRHSRRSVPMKRSAIAFARGARTGVRRMRMSAPANTASKAAVNLLSRSRIRNRNCSARSPRSMSRLRACWVTQAPVGWAVIPARCTRRRPCSITTRT